MSSGLETLDKLPKPQMRLDCKRNQGKVKKAVEKLSANNYIRAILATKPPHVPSFTMTVHSKRVKVDQPHIMYSTVTTSDAMNLKKLTAGLAGLSTQFDTNESLHESVDNEDSTTMTSHGRSLSEIMDDVASQHQKSHRVDDPLFSPRSPLVTQHFDSVEADPTISPSRNIYFMDGANRFISLPIQAGTSRSSHVARTFEQWLQDKLGYQQYRMTDHLPIVEDSVDLLAEDIMNRIKSRTCVRGLTGIRSLMIKIRAGHVYSLDQLDPIPSLSSDMMDFFQQFPLFIEITILVATPDSLLPGSPLSPRSPAMDYTIPVLISLENISANPADPSDPYYLFEDVSLIV